MLKYTELSETIRYDVMGWPGFYVLIVPNAKKDCYTFYLTHENQGIIHYMFGWPTSNPDFSIEKLVELAHWNVEEYLPDFVKDCCTEEDEEEPEE
jgi:hypothetical protein